MVSTTRRVGQTVRSCFVDPVKHQERSSHRWGPPHNSCVLGMNGMTAVDNGNDDNRKLTESAASQGDISRCSHEPSVWGCNVGTGSRAETRTRYSKVNWYAGAHWRGGRRAAFGRIDWRRAVASGAAMRALDQSSYTARTKSGALKDNLPCRREEVGA